MTLTPASKLPQGRRSIPFARRREIRFALGCTPRARQGAAMWTARLRPTVDPRGSQPPHWQPMWGVPTRPPRRRRARWGRDEDPLEAPRRPRHPDRTGPAMVPGCATRSPTPITSRPPRRGSSMAPRRPGPLWSPPPRGLSPVGPPPGHRAPLHTTGSTGSLARANEQIVRGRVSGHAEPSLMRHIQSRLSPDRGVDSAPVLRARSGHVLAEGLWVGRKPPTRGLAGGPG